MIAPATCSRATSLLGCRFAVVEKRGARKIPRAPIWVGIAHLVAAAGAGAQAPDTAAVYRQARRAEVAYEAAIRRLAPTSPGRDRARSCDEVVGRYCLFFDDGKDVLPAEPAEIGMARDTAIARLQEAAALAPGRTPTIFPLVRFLVQDGRAAEAEAAAHAYARATTDSTPAYMVLGYALHEARNTTAAAVAFERWLGRLSEPGRRAIESLKWLLERQEYGRYEKAGEQQRAAFAVRAWKYADPLLLTAGNELWTDHVARHALAAMLAKRPGVPGVDGWGEDLEQLTVRFGAPAITTRSWRAGAMGGSSYDYSEHWNPSQRTYFAPSLTAALARSAPLDTVWPLDSLPTRSGHAPPGIRRMEVLEHQAAVLRDSTSRFVIWGRAQADSLVSRALIGRVFLLDSLLDVVADTPAAVLLDGDSITLRAELPVPSEARYYSAEIYDPESRYAARARFRIDDPARNGHLELAGVLLAQPFEPGALPEDRASSALRPLNRPVITQGSGVGIYTEATVKAESGLTSLHIELENRRTDGRSALGRIAGWIGKRIGLGNRKGPTRLGWNVDVQTGGNPLPVTLDLSALEPGRYQVELTARAPRGGASIVARRDFLVISAKK